ncbi:hypothetical protein [Couchioplanes azureus]|uniref:hypothetical protein n=1 Tax=Couchioplanes caeruleus TaxID=56438 RepID=UPI001670DDDB|nr:hypothetical protein GCM10010166_21000 [Couchioplanes caeruleus subsp. azureus]
MIVASLLLILVAVVLLVLGLAGGSSTLLIGSIVASLLAAVALVIGARQASAGRRAVGEPLPADLEDPPSTTASALRGEPVAARGEPASAARGEPVPPHGEPASAARGEPVPPGRAERVSAVRGEPGVRAGQAASASPGGSAMAAAFAEADLPVRRAGFGEAGPSASGPSPADTPDEGAELSPGQSREDHDPARDGAVASDSEPDRAAARAAGQRDTEAILADRSRTAAGGPGPDVTQRLEHDGEEQAGLGTARAEGPTGSGGLRAPHSGAARAPHSGPDADRAAGDYDQASSMIGGARAEDDDSWRRASEAAPAGDPPSEPAWSEGGPREEPAWSEAGPREEPAWSEAGPREEPAWSEAGPREEPAWSEAGPREEPAWSEAGPRDEPAWSGRGASVSADEFGDPDPDDPDDEPLPQRVRPADAVRVARLDAEVVVVDGRPRYHLADCPHLSARQTEALPVAEAVELGFSPCGQCRPVDRLVAAALRH